MGSSIEIVELLMTPEFRETRAGDELPVPLPIEPMMVSAGVLATVADAGSPQGVLAVAELARSGVEAIPIVNDGIYVLLASIQDPGNLGALARSAEAAGASGVALGTGSVHPNHPKALRASAGSLLRLPVAVGIEPQRLLAHLESATPTLIALDSSSGRDLYSTELAGTLVLALGSEGAGLSPELRSLADLRVTIPSAPRVESLNLTVAASVVLHELARRRRVAVSD